MTGDAFVLICLGGLALFILWEGWQHRRPSEAHTSRKNMEHGFIPGASSRELALFALAAAMFLFGFTLIANPPLPPFSGRSAPLNSVLFDLFGVWGAPLACWVLAISLSAIALRLRRERFRR